jgi:hypothetical protein
MLRKLKYFAMKNNTEMLKYNSGAENCLNKQIITNIKNCSTSTRFVCGWGTE